MCFGEEISTALLTPPSWLLSPIMTFFNGNCRFRDAAHKDIAQCSAPDGCSMTQKTNYF